MLQTHPVDVYDYIYSWKNYKAEAKVIQQILETCQIEPNAKILEVACGTGRYLEHFPNMQCFGVDLCERSIQYAQMRVPHGVFTCQDMCDLSEFREVDVILGLFGALGYIPPEKPLEEALRGFYHALRPNGICIVEPWVSLDDFVPGEVFVQAYQSPNFKVARTVMAERSKGTCILDFHFVVCRAGWGVERFKCQEKLWLHDHGVILKDLQKVGFEVVEVHQGFLQKSPLYVCRRPSAG